jgi:hypothetical protein
MKYIIDRFEADFAVCETETGEIINIKKATLPNNIKEGSIIKKTETGYIIDKTEEQTKIAKIKELEKKLFTE